MEGLDEYSSKPSSDMDTSFLKHFITIDIEISPKALALRTKNGCCCLVPADEYGPSSLAPALGFTGPLQAPPIEHPDHFQALAIGYPCPIQVLAVGYVDPLQVPAVGDDVVQYTAPYPSPESLPTPASPHSPSACPVASLRIGSHRIAFIPTPCQALPITTHFQREGHRPVPAGL